MSAIVLWRYQRKSYTLSSFFSSFSFGISQQKDTNMITFSVCLSVSPKRWKKKYRQFAQISIKWNVKKEEYNNMISLTAWKISVFRVFLVRIFQHLGLNTERYSVSPLIQSECWKIRTKKTQNTDTFQAVRIVMITNHFKYYSPWKIG